MSFSVVIPIFNKENTLVESILSVINQDLSVSEIILINDGSTDSSDKIVKEVIQSNPSVNIRYIEQENRGVSAARNTGIELAESEFICFLDADDLWDKDFVSSLRLLIHDFPEADMYCMHHRVIRNEYEFIPKHGLKNKTRGYVKDFFRASCSGSIAKTSKVCVRKKVFLNERNLFPEGVVAGEDLYVWIQIALKGKVACDNKVVCTVIQEEDNSRGARLNSIPYPLVYFTRSENKCELTFQSKNYIANIGIKHVVSDILKSNFNSAFNRWKLVWKLSPIRAVIPFYYL